MQLLRQLYYLIPTDLRYVARYLYYLPADSIDFFRNGNKDLIPPRRLIYTGPGNFKAIGQAFIDLFIAKEILNKNSSVLDVGSGIGRLAIPLTQYLDTHTKYEGFDIVKHGVDWCTKHITSAHPNFTFQHVSLQNDLYNKGGKSSAGFIFPYADNQFDLATLTSVFTHMLPDEIEQYLKEIHRVLKPGGHCFATFFLLDDESKTLMQQGDGFNFKYKHGNHSLLDEKVRHANVALELDYLNNLVELIPGLAIKEFIRGNWSRGFANSEVDFQDSVIFVKDVA